MVLLATLVGFAGSFIAFNNRQIVESVTSLLDWPYTSPRVNYDLRPLRRKGADAPISKTVRLGPQSGPAVPPSPTGACSTPASTSVTRNCSPMSHPAVRPAQPGDTSIVNSKGSSPASCYRNRKTPTNT